METLRPTSAADEPEDRLSNVVHFDIQDTTPDDVDAVAALEAAAAYFELLAIASQEDDDEPIGLTGLHIEEKCLRFSTAADPFDARLQPAACLAAHWIGGAEDPPPKLRTAVERARSSCAKLFRPLSVSVANWTQAIPIPLPNREPSEEVQFWTITTMRARVVSVGGETPKARLKPRNRSSFVVSVTKPQACSLGKHIYEEVDLRLRIQRDDTGKVASGGTLLSYEPLENYTPEQALAAWHKYHDAVAAGWDDIEDIEKELGRD